MSDDIKRLADDATRDVTRAALDRVLGTEHAPAQAAGETDEAKYRFSGMCACNATGPCKMHHDQIAAAARAEERKVCWHKEFETRGIIAEAVRKEERERVWKLADAASCTPQIVAAALADGIDLTSLTDEK